MEQKGECIIKEQLIEKAKYYTRIINKLDAAERIDIEGYLRISVDGNKKRYFFRSNVSEKEQYICSAEIEKAAKLAQKKYNEKVYELAKKRLTQIKTLLKDYDDFEIDNLYEKAHAARKELITPIEITYEQKYNNWIESEFQSKDFRVGTPIIMTEKGERVRSKSEKLIADYLYRNGIEYKYEKPLYLKGYGNVFPDFTLYSTIMSREIYWEHNGMMDDPEYAKKAINKITSYEENGIYIGSRLIVTFETSEKVLGTNDIKSIVDRYGLTH